MEYWKDIKGYEGLYQVSNYGRVKNKINNKILKPQILTKGYLGVTLYTNKTKRTVRIHRLVAEAFIPNPYNYPQVNHKDENKNNNSVENLEWCDNSYNHSYGTRNKRVSNKLTNGKKSKPILQYDLEGNFIKEWPSIMEISRQTSYSQGNISSCCRGKYDKIYGYIWKFKDAG